MPFDISHRAFRFDGNATELVLYREACWQIELIIMQPNVEVPLHAHDRSSSFDVFLGGAAEGAEFDAAMQRYATRGLPTKLIPAGAPHGGRTGSQGLAVLSFQQWHRQPVTFVGEDWRRC